MTGECLSFDGQTVLILGASGGIGRAVCASLTKRGARVIGIGWDQPDLGTARSCAAYVVRDLRQADATEECITVAWKSHGPFDAMINIAGVFPARTALDTSEDFFDDVFAINVRSGLISAVCVSRLAISSGRGMRIVLTSSGAARHPRAGNTVYSASKAATESIIRSLALELAPYDIRVNSVAPGFVDVQSELSPVPEHYIAALERASTHNRVARPEDIVPSYLWLIHPASEWVNGQVIDVDAGMGLGNLSSPNWLPDSPL